ncbi:MAG: MFS transporter [Chloroflexota bacterium]|nr:MFS transporter [Chloroflexota bacterium]
MKWGQPITGTKRKISYAWIATIAGAFIVFIAGNFQYTFGVFLKPLIYKFGWSRAAISAAVTSRSIASSIASPFAGILGDRYGHRRVMLVGIGLVGLGYLLAARVTSLWQLYIFLGALVGLGMPAFYVPLVTIITGWFGPKSSFPNGIIASGFGWAQIIVPPVMTYLLLKYGLATSCVILGAAVLVLGAAAWSFVKTPPEKSGPPQPGKNMPEVMTIPDETNYTLSEALHTPAVWLLCLVQAIIAAAFQMVVIHVIAAATDTGITAEVAATILTISGITNTLGRLTLGGLAVKVGNRVVLTICVALQALALYMLTGASDLNVFYAATMLHGFGYGGVIPIIATLTGAFYGTRSMGSIYGVVNTSYTAGGIIGPILAGYIFDVTGSYRIAFTYAAIATTVAFVLCLVLRPPRRKAAPGYEG